MNNKLLLELFLVFTLLNPITNTSIAANKVFTNKMAVAYKDSRGVTVAFPDVCKTPSPGGPVPIPYPNMAKTSDSEYGSGSKKTKAGGTLVIKKRILKIRNRATQVYSIKVLSRSGRPVRLRTSRLLRLQDGSYCAICVRRGRITRILKLRAIKVNRMPAQGNQDAAGRISPTL